MTRFLNPNDRLFMRVSPFTGKYAAKRADIFEEIAGIQSEKMRPEWLYKPINSEIEITDRCNQSCPHCGMAANGMNGTSYSAQKIVGYINQLHDNVIIFCSITGGEPLLPLQNTLVRSINCRCD